MAIVSQGSLADWSAARLFATLGGRAFTGELVIAAGGREYRVAWEGGAIVGARSPHPADSAAKIAITLGVINSTQAGEVARLLAGSPGLDEIDVVAQVARLSTELIGRLVRRVAGARASRALSPEAGEFTVDNELPFWGTVAPVDARWVLYNGIRTHMTIERIERELARSGDAITLREGADITGFGFGPPETVVLDRMAAGALALAPVPDELDTQLTLAMSLALLLTGEASVMTVMAPPKPVTQPIPKPATKEASKPVPAPAPAAAARPAASPAPVPAPAAKEPARAPRRGAANADQIKRLVAERLTLLDGGADFFRLLDVALDSSMEDIRTRYFALARNLHPDRLEAAGVTDDKKDAQRLFAKMNEAFTTLTDPGKRQKYTEVVRAGGEAAVKAREAQTEAAVRKALDAEERFRLGEMALRRQQLEVAVREFQKAIELDPEESDHHAMLGWALYVAAPSKGAALPAVRGHLLTAADKNKKNPLPHLYLGRIARMENNLADAEKHLTRALELAPGHAEASAELRAVQAARPSKPPDNKGGLFSRLTKKS